MQTDINNCVDMKVFRSIYGELAVTGAKALNEDDLALLAKLLRENFTTGKAVAIYGAAERVNVSAVMQS